MAEENGPTRWALTQELFEAVTPLSPEARAAYLEAHAPDDTLRDEVMSLVAAAHGEGGLDEIVDALARATDAPGGGGVGALDASDPDGPPREIGGYAVVERVGRGGMSVVYRARRPPDEEGRFAVKLLRHGADERLRRRFADELALLRGLEHPDIVAPVDDGATPEGRPFFVMEYVAGRPLDAYCDEGEVGLDERLELLATLCDIVEHAHRRGVVHRDLKPANVMVEQGGRVRLLDFGIAKVVGELFPSLRRKTTTGIALMTPRYASPEQLLDRPVTPASDVYQLGLLACELLTGRVPPVETRIGPAGAPAPRPAPLVELLGGRGARRRGIDPAEVARRRGTTTEALVSRLVGPVDEAVRTALASEAAERFPTAGDFARALRSALVREGDSWNDPVSRLDSDVTGRTVARQRISTRGIMKRLFGFGVGALYLVIAFAAFTRARTGWADGYPDIGFWFTVIATFLTIASLSAFAGTWIHTQPDKG